MTTPCNRALCFCQLANAYSNRTQNEFEWSKESVIFIALGAIAASGVILSIVSNHLDAIGIATSNFKLLKISDTLLYASLACVGVGLVGIGMVGLIITMQVKK
jgi:hypothetical protein